MSIKFFTSRSRRWLDLGLAFSLIFTLASLDAEAARKRRYKKKKRPPVVNEKKLYERLGGAKSVGEIVDEWVRANLADPRIAPAFTVATVKPENLVRWRKGLSEQICEWSDGPCKAKSVDSELKKSQLSLAKDEALYLAYSDNLLRTLDKKNIPEREKNELLWRLGEFRSEIFPESGT